METEIALLSDLNSCDLLELAFLATVSLWIICFFLETHLILKRLGGEGGVLFVFETEQLLI